MVNNEFTLKDLYKGKETILKNKEYFATRFYVEPFIERMSKFTDDFRVDAKIPDQITKTNDLGDVTYNRVLVQAVLPKEHCIDAHDEVIGFLYGIDVRKPVVKLYRGYLNQACTNLTVFNPHWINVQELIPGDPINFNPVMDLMEAANDFQLVLQKLKSNFVDRQERKRLLGEWVDYALRENEDYGFGKVKIAVSTPIDAYKSMFINSDSEYYIPEGMDPNYYDIMNAFTQIITNDKKDIMNKFEKTMIINRILGIDTL